MAATLIALIALADTYSLRWTPKAGDKLTFSSEANIAVNGSPALIKSKSTEQVLKVDSNGLYSVQSSVLDGTVEMNGQQFPMPKSLQVTLYQSDGEIVSITGDQVQGTTYRSAELAALKRPEAPVGIGDSWNEDIKADAKTGVVGVKGTFKLDSIEKVGDADALKIIASAHETEGLEAGMVDAIYWISKADGSLLKYTAKWTNVTFPGAPEPLSGTMSMARVPN